MFMWLGSDRPSFGHLPMCYLQKGLENSASLRGTFLARLTQWEINSLIYLLYIYIYQKGFWYCACVCSVMSNPMQPRGLKPVRLLCPWNSPGKNTRVGCLVLLQGSSQPRDWTRVSCFGRQVLYHQCHLGSFWYWALKKKKKDKYPLLLPNSEGNDLSICHPTFSHSEQHSLY